MHLFPLVLLKPVHAGLPAQQSLSDLRFVPASAVLHYQCGQLPLDPETWRLAPKRASSTTV